MATKKENRDEKRSDCPVSCTLDLVGDKWSLLIIRDILFFGKSTYNEFLASNEKISTNILSDRLEMLTAKGIIKYTGTAKRKKYALTSIGKDLKPLLDSIRTFGSKHFEGSKEYVKRQLKEARQK
jgi:DNA-binding HxlR family transcriptional regulator